VLGQKILSSNVIGVRLTGNTTTIYKYKIKNWVWNESISGVTEIVLTESFPKLFFFAERNDTLFAE
jgi:hypothetical protein